MDITNFVMLEYGQPLHAFDIRTVRGSHIIVDTAADGEKFTTLDGNERTLTSSMLMIKDEGGPTAVAGVMGGLASEIEDDTSMVLVESANFLGDSVRRTSKALGLRTEASGRFEKGIDPNLAKDACDRFCYLVEKLGAGTVLTGDVD
ncbi:MAG: phenylalanine--tRNA ligase subunit beta, partial [Firmicutes bacterium]|nr:phenylalanine--tRNA ligase subunit beta [Bacillota bacterium]